MYSVFKYSAAVMLLLLSGCISQNNQQIQQITGKIVTATRPSNLSTPIANAQIKLLYSGVAVTSDQEGEFTLELTGFSNIKQKYLVVVVSAEDYQSRELNITIGDYNNIELSLQTHYKYFPPVQLDDGILTKNLSSVSVNPTPINQLMAKLVSPDKNKVFRELHSLLIYKNGHLVLEEYFHGNSDFINFENNISRDSRAAPIQWDRTRKHYVASINKALTATLAGIALEQYSLSVEDKISTLLPQKEHHFSDKNKQKLTIRHLLTMQLGFDWDEWGSNDLALMWQSDDFGDFVLSRDNHGPGTDWVYNSASPNLMLSILENLVEPPLRDWADKNFYSKLGITDYQWESQPDGTPEGSARMQLRPRDMLKVGITYLNQGKWHNQQVIPKQWVEEIFTLQATGEAGEYSYYFWLRELDGIRYISADGDGGQYINIFPEQDMVIVMTQGNYLEWPLYSKQADDIMQNYIFPALSL